MNPNFRPVQQKRREMALESQKVTGEEVGKLLKVGSIRDVQFPNRMANVVLVKKSINR